VASELGGAADVGDGAALSGGGFAGDMLYDIGNANPNPEAADLIDPADPTRRKRIPPGSAFEDLLIPVIRNGERIGKSPALETLRERTTKQLSQLHPGSKRFHNPHAYPVGLDPSLHSLRLRLIAEAKGIPLVNLR